MKERQRSKRGRTVKILLLLLVVIIAIRLALPYFVLKYANKTLATMPGYRGHVTDIKLALIRGAYKIDSIYLNQRDSASGKETPFFGAKTIDLSVEWRALLKGKIVGEIKFIEPTLRFTKDKTEPDDVKGDSTDFKNLLEDFMPLKVNRFEVINGNIQYIDEHSSPKVDVTMTNTHIVATNLRNSYDSSSLLPARIQGSAEVYDGTLDVDIKLNPLADVPTFDMNAELQGTNLVKLNDFFEAYAKVDVSKGTLDVFAEVAAKEGKFKGYVKPLLKDVSILGKEDRDDNILKKAWEGLVGAVGQVVENLSEQQVGTKIPFEGDVQDPKANIWHTIAYILQNAFVQALQPTIENEINIANVGKEEEKKGFLERIFGGKDDKDDKKDKKEKKDD